MNEKKNKKSAIVLLGALIFIVALYFVFNKTENQKTENALKTDVSVPKVKIEKKAESETKTKEVVEKPKKETKKAVQETEEYQGVDGDKEKRVIKPYDLSTLPPEPDAELVKTEFVDVNNNKVRDDIEIAVAEAFEDDADLVESYFAEARTSEYDLYLARNKMFDDESIKESMNNITYTIRCNGLLYDDVYAKESEWNSFDMARSLVLSKVFNTDEKRKLRDGISRASHGFAGGQFTPTYSECKEFFESTKNLPIGG